MSLLLKSIAAIHNILLVDIYEISSLFPAFS